MIRSYGISEDIPYGINTGITVAYMASDFFHRTYLGINFGIAKYLENFGYIGGNIIAGGFYRSGVPSQGLFESNMLYYTPLIRINRFSSRIFLRFKYREAITRDVDITFNFGENIRNLDQVNIAGISSMVFNLEISLFSPWYLYGFRFVPFAFADIGWISSSRYAFINSNSFTVLGVGFRIRNESLAIKNIIIYFGYIPHTQQENKNYFFNY